MLYEAKICLKLTDQQLRISLSFRLGAKICEKHTCRCGKLIEENGHHGLSCARSAGRFARHHNLNTPLRQALSSIKVPSILEPNGLTRTDGKRPDGITIAPWEEGKQLVWDVTCVDLLAPSRIENGSVANPGTAAGDAEDLETAKYVCLTDKGYIFQPLAFEMGQGYFVTSHLGDNMASVTWATIWRRSLGRQKCQPNGLIKLIN